MGHWRFAGCALLLIVGCGESATQSGDPSAGGGGSANASAAGGDSNLGGSRAGMSSATGGTSGEGPGGIPEAGAGGEPDSNQCRKWPKDRLLPTIGPLFYGPDPGPCTETGISSGSETVGTYSYDSQARVAKLTFGNTVRTYQYQGDALASTTYSVPSQPDSVVTYVWSASKVTETTSGSIETVREYSLDAAGYATELWLVNPEAGTRQLYATYKYVDCRLTHKDTLDSDGAIIPSLTSDYTYDDAGHMTARNNQDGTSIVYDYGCW